MRAVGTPGCSNVANRLALADGPTRSNFVSNLREMGVAREQTIGTADVNDLAIFPVPSGKYDSACSCRTNR